MVAITVGEPIAKPRKGAAPQTSADTEFKQLEHAIAAYSRHIDVSKARALKAIPIEACLLCDVTEANYGDKATMLRHIRAGLPFRAFDILMKACGASRKELAQVLSIPIATLNRRRKAGKLLVDESDRVARLARIKDAALALMLGDDDAAVEWLHTPQEILGNETPMEHASTEMGARDVEDLIGRIQHGVFS